MNKSRERFEAWLRADIAPLCDFERHSRKDAKGNYIDSWVLSSWSAWQAAEAATVERCASLVEECTELGDSSEIRNLVYAIADAVIRLGDDNG